MAENRSRETLKRARAKEHNFMLTSRHIARVGLVATALLAATMMTACSGGGSPSGGASGGGAAATTIKVVYQKTASFTAADDLMQKVKTEYEAANPGVTVQLDPITAEADQYYTKLALMEGSPATAPDVIYEDTFQVRSDAAAGYLLPIDDYLAKWSDWSQFSDGAKQAGLGDDGKTYGVSMGSDTRGIYYNKTIFQKVGLPTDWQPKTWADVLSAAETVKAKDPSVAPLNIFASKAAGEATTMQGFEMLLYGTNNQLMDTQSSKWLTGSQGFKDSLSFIQQLFSKKLVPSMDVALDANLQSIVSTQLLPQGKVAMAIDGSWLPGGWMTGPNAWPQWNTTLGVAKMPTQNGQAPGAVSMSGGWLLSVGADTKAPQAAFNFVATALNKDNSLAYDIANSQIAVRQDVASDPSYLNTNPTAKFFSDLMSVTHFRPATPDYPQISQAIQVACESVATGQATPDQAAATYDQSLISIVGQDKTQAAS